MRTIRQKRASTMTANATPPSRLASPYPWFGGKSQVSAEVWARFGNPSNYVEPFAGSLAVLLGRPNDHRWWERNETVNDLDGNIANWHRSVAADPETVALHASQPVNEVDLTARHVWLVQNGDRLRQQLFSDPTFYDARAAGWWVYGISAWVGGEWCTGIGPFTGTDEPSRTNGGTAPGVYRKIPMISGAHGGKGIHKPIAVPESDDTDTAPPVSDLYLNHLNTQFAALSDRMRRVRVACGDWTRVLGNAAVPASGHYTAVFLDPPYDPTERRGDLYAVGDNRRKKGASGTDALDLGDTFTPTPSVHEAARTWALDKTTDASYRIAYCSYSTPEEDALFGEAGWAPYRWSAKGGYALAADSADNRARSNKDREVIWFSPTCETPTTPQPSLF
jgi:DNA adenine methylase